MGDFGLPPESSLYHAPLTIKEIAILQDMSSKVLHPILVFRNLNHRLVKRTVGLGCRNLDETIILRYKMWLLPVFAVFTIRHLSQIFQNICVCFHCKQVNCQCQSMTVYQFALYAQLFKTLLFGKKWESYSPLFRGACVVEEARRIADED